MRPDLIGIALFAVIAAFVLFQLYNVLGRRVGRQPGDNAPAPAPAGPVSLLGLRSREPAPSEPAGVAAIRARDPEFDPVKFLEKAAQAYTVIVKAFAAGDRATLAPMLSPLVAQSFNAAIDQRETDGRSQAVEFLHPPRADLDRLDVEGDLARARVRFLAELRTRSKGPEGEGVDDRRTAELWTFERSLAPGAAGWSLARVEAAEA
jgi:predicted lipid-binding transport protein (Tim44 family)